MAPLLALVVALRVIAAPLVIAAPEPGLIAICSGGQIHYVSLDGTPVDPDASPPDPCPFLGITLALADPTPEIVAPRRDSHTLAPPVAPVSIVPPEPARPNPARAPPLFV